MTERYMLLGGVSRTAMVWALVGLGGALAVGNGVFVSPAQAQIATQAGADVCPVEEEDIGILILQGLQGLAAQSANAATEASKQKEDRSTEQSFAQVERRFGAISTQIGNVLGGGIGGSVRPGLFGLMNFSIQNIVNATGNFQQNYLPVQSEAGTVDQLLAQSKGSSAALGKTDDYIGFVQVTGLLASLTKYAGKRVFIWFGRKPPVAPGASAAGGAAQDLVATQSLSAAAQDVQATQRLAGAAQDAQATQRLAGAAQDVQATQRLAGAAQDVQATQRVGAGAAAVSPPRMSPSQLIEPGKMVEVQFASGGKPITQMFSDGADLIKEVVDPRVLQFAERAGIDVARVVAEVIEEAKMLKGPVTAAAINERVIVQFAESLGLIEGLKGNAATAASQLLQNLYIAIGSGSKANLGKYVLALDAEIVRNYPGGVRQFLYEAARAFETADDAAGIVQMFTREQLALLKAALESSGDMASIERLLGPTAMAWLRRTGEVPGTVALVDAASSSGLDAWRVAFKTFGALEDLGALDGKEPAAKPQPGQAQRPGGTPADERQAARAAIESLVKSANPSLQQAGGLLAAVFSIDLVRNTQGKGTAGIFGHVAWELFANPFKLYGDVTFMELVGKEVLRLAEEKKAEFAAMQEAFRQTLEALRAIDKAFDEAGVGSITSFIGGEAVERIEAMIAQIDGTWEFASKEFREANAERYAELRERLVTERDNLLTSDEQLRLIHKKVKEALAILQSVETAPDGKPRAGKSGIAFFDPAVFVAMSQVAALFETLGNTVTSGGPVAEIVSPPAETASAPPPKQSVTFHVSTGRTPAAPMVATVGGLEESSLVKQPTIWYVPAGGSSSDSGGNYLDVKLYVPFEFTQGSGVQPGGSTTAVTPGTLPPAPPMPAAPTTSTTSTTSTSVTDPASSPPVSSASPALTIPGGDPIITIYVKPSSLFSTPDGGPQQVQSLPGTKVSFSVPIMPALPNGARPPDAESLHASEGPPSCFTGSTGTCEFRQPGGLAALGIPTQGLNVAPGANVIFETATPTVEKVVVRGDVTKALPGAGKKRGNLETGTRHASLGVDETETSEDRLPVRADADGSAQSAAAQAGVRVAGLDYVPEVVPQAKSSAAWPMTIEAERKLRLAQAKRQTPPTPALDAETAAKVSAEVVNIGGQVFTFLTGRGFQRGKFTETAAQTFKVNVVVNPCRETKPRAAMSPGLAAAHDLPQATVTLGAAPSADRGRASP